MTRNLLKPHHLVAGLLAGAMMFPATVMADHVTLHSNDGSVEIVGDLVGVEDSFYVIKTIMGEMQISLEDATCEGEACPKAVASQTIPVAGSDSMGYGLMPPLLAGFAKQQGGMMMAGDSDHATQYNLLKIDADGHNHAIGIFDVKPTVSGDAFARLLEKTAEIGLSTRRITPQEVRLLRASGAGDMTASDQERVVGIGGLVVITNPDVGIDVIGAKQIGMIYSGKITNWKQVGGPDLPIVKFDRQGNSGPGAIFNNMFYKNLGFTKGGDVQELPSNAAMVAAVNSQSGAIGFVEHASAAASHSLAFKSQCGLVFRPNAFALKTEEYPFISRLYMYNRADNTGDTARAFLDYAISPAADEVVTEAGFIGLGILRASQNSMGGRLGSLMNAEVPAGGQALADHMMVDLLQFDRLSTTFRFASGSSSFDNKAKVDMERLVEYLAGLDGKVEVALVGFTDTDGGFNQNRVLSESRARNVAAALVRAGVGRIGDNITISTRGYGELSPAVCNLSRKAKGINRRVEVWIRPAQ